MDGRSLSERHSVWKAAGQVSQHTREPPDNRVTDTRQQSPVLSLGQIIGRTTGLDNFIGSSLPNRPARIRPAISAILAFDCLICLRGVAGSEASH